MSLITFEPLTIDTSSEDHDARLVFAEGILEAVVVQIAAEGDGIAKPGDWFLEIGFGACGGSGNIFNSLDEVRAWVHQQVRQNAALRGHKTARGRNSSNVPGNNLIRAYEESSRSRKKPLITVEEYPKGVPGTLGDLLYTKIKDSIREHEWVRLIQSIAAGDPFALHALYDMAHRLVFTLSVRITANRELAEELTIDVFRDIWRRVNRRAILTHHRPATLTPSV